MSDTEVKKTKKNVKVSLADTPDSFEIPPDSEKVIVVEILGAPEGMLQNQLQEATKQELQYGKKAGATETRAQRTEKAKASWESTGHFANDGNRGHPSEAFLKAMQESVPYVSLSGGKKTSNKKAIPRCITVLPDAFSKEGLPLTCFSNDTQANARLGIEPAEHWAVNKTSGGAVPVPVYRTHIQGGWKMKVKISYDSSMMRVQDVLMLMQKAGSSVGVGSWRKEKGGVFGRWKVVGAQAVG